MTKKEIKQIIRQLKTYEMDVRDVPKEVCYHKDIIEAERKFGLRKAYNRGYDAVHELFFVEEKLFNYREGEMECCNNKLTFPTFEEYYDYLDGDIYESACYKFLDFQEYIDYIRDKEINVDALVKRETFLTETIDDLTIEVSEEEVSAYREKESNKSLIEKWIKKFNACKTADDLAAMVKKYDKSKLKDDIDVILFFYCYIFSDVMDQDRFKAIMNYISTGLYPEYKLRYALCSIYNPQDVLDNYKYSKDSIDAKTTFYTHKRKIKNHIKELEAGKIEIRKRYYFDKRLNYFCEQTEAFPIPDKIGCYIYSYKRIFFNFDQFVAYTRGDLRGADLSGALELNVDFHNYKIDKTTRLPITSKGDFTCEINKKYENGKFVVNKEWRTKEGCLVKKNTFETPYFFDFVYYLKGDLSGADLVSCDGLKNLKAGYEKIDFSGANMTSTMCEKFGVAYEKYDLNTNVIGSFPITEKNEKDTSDMMEESMELRAVHGEELSVDILGEHNWYCTRIYYVTDLHLMHYLQNMQCKSKQDVIYALTKISEEIANKSGDIILIGGDVCSDFHIFQQFVNKLSNQMDENQKIVFVLGNHEFWEFPGQNMDEIVATYRRVIEDNGMYLLHNEILYENPDQEFHIIPYEELITVSSETLKRRLQRTRLVILGGTGFSGYNESFNANQGIYRNTLNRAEEIAESKKFETLYEKVQPAICDKKTIIFTHTPKCDWSVDATPYKNLVYVSGHTHRNEFYDDGEYRIYADNQIGYSGREIHTKCFLMDSEYNIFADYEDGIYEITADQYMDFYRGKNIKMNFGREINILYMLKKKGYYCFIHESTYGVLSILNGGALRHLERTDVKYYYDHMDEITSAIESPLNQYLDVQRRISEEIKQIGGDGRIHGCIIDIDWYNHIYVNPIDMKIVGYWAENMINKLVYPDIPSLLKVECPDYYKNYQKLLKEEGIHLLLPEKNKRNEVILQPQKYLGTDIYRASREIKKMQKLTTSNILTVWYEKLKGGKLLPGE